MILEGGGIDDRNQEGECEYEHDRVCGRKKFEFFEKMKVENK